MATKAKEGKYKGERTLLPSGKYPITKNGKLNCGRVRNAVARAAQQGATGAIKKGGIMSAIKQCGIKSKLDSTKKKSKK